MLNRVRRHWMTAGLILVLSTQICTPAYAKKKSSSICEDDLTTRTGLRWGGSRKLPFKRVVDIRECLVDTHLGKVTAGRHGKSSFQISEIFGKKQPFPGERYYISLWGSKIEGCFVEMIVQDAPVNGQVNVPSIVPKFLELGIGGELIQLPAQVSLETTKILKSDYSYTQYVSGANRNYNSTWFMTRNLFAIDSQVLEFLRNAPEGEVRARLTFADDSTQLLKISPETVESWDAAFGFNPTCESPDAEPASTEA